MDPNQSSLAITLAPTTTIIMANAAEQNEGQQAPEGTCEIGSLEMPPAEWLFSAAAAFQQSYGQIHPYLAAGLCIAGTLMNLVTVLVLTRPSMRSPVNVLLCAVACCDILVESSYLVFVLHFLLASAQRCEPSDFSWAWALFMIFHAHASVIFHAASIWMTVSLAQIRVLTIRRATSGPTTPLITERFTAILALLTTLAMVLVNVPNFLTFEIMEVPASAMLPCWQPPEMMAAHSIPSPIPLPQIQQTTTTQIPENNRNWTTENFGGKRPSQEELEKEIEQLIANLTGPILSTIAPMLAGANAINRTRRQHRLKRFRRDIPLPHLSPTPPSLPFEEPLVYTVRAHESDCMKLKLAFWSNGMIFKVIPCLLLTLSIVALLRIIADVAHKRRNLAQVMRKKVPKDHTTPMLAAILLIFLLAELPQGVFLVLNGIYSSESFHKRVYLPLGDLMDLLSLLNSAVGFLIYVGMSRKFRTVFLQLLFSAISCIFSKTPCAPWGLPPGGESTDGCAGGGSKSWRRTSASQQLFHSGFHNHSEQPSGQQTALLVKSNGGGGGGRTKGGGKGWKKCRKGKAGKGRNGGKGGGGDFDGWLRWRKFSRNTKSTELTATSRTEQLSLCPSSLLGLPPITLAVSCSAGITAAAASVGVHLLQLDPPTSSSASGQHQENSPDGISTSISSPLLILAPPTTPPTITNGIIRRPSNESDCSNWTAGSVNGSQHFLNVPGQQPQPNSPSSIFFISAASSESCPPKRASFLSLRGEDGERMEQQRHLERPKRISFNLPPQREDEEEEDGEGKERSRTLTNGHLSGRSGKKGADGIGQKLRRSFLLSLATNQKKLNSMLVDEEGESRLAVEEKNAIEDEAANECNMANGEDYFVAAATATTDAECPGKALLKLQRNQQQGSIGGRHHRGNRAGNRDEGNNRRIKLTSALARALLGRLASATTATSMAKDDPEKMDSTGSGSPQHKFGALRTETNYNGWMAYC